MAIADFESKLAGARTFYQGMASDLFDGDVQGTWQMLCQKETQKSGRFWRAIEAGQIGLAREWVGDKVYDSFRLYGHSIEIKSYEKSIEVSRREITDDTTGTVQRKLGNLLRSQAQLYDYKVLESLRDNPTGIDGVSLINDSHPFGSSTTWDNKVTTSLSYAAYNTGKSAMRALKGETGRFLGVRPTHLLVGPALERTAKEITGADRPVPVATTGAEASSGVVASSTITNVYQGDVTVIVSEHFADGTHDNDWILMDLSKDVKPMVLIEQRGLEAHDQFDMDDEQRFNRDVFRASVECEIGFGGLFPHLVYGKST